MNWPIVAEYEDRESGSKSEKDRPKFKAMLEAASKREFDVLLFWSLDRFTREGMVEALTTLKRLNDYGVKYRSLQEPYIDTTNPFGDLLAAFVAKIAQLERERIRERIYAGLERAKAEGKELGRPRLAVDRTKIRRLRAEGLSVRAIAQKTGYSHGTVQRALE
jgi:DNA invertase Pin-like site-specific DNA recombinase